MNKIRKPRILIVDDVPANIKVIMDILGDEYDISVATDGVTALDIVSEGGIDLVLLDIIMPGMDGYEVIRHLKENRATAHIPVIFMTAKEDTIDEVKGFKLGAVDYIKRYADPIIVKVRIGNVIELNQNKDVKLVMNDDLTGIPNRRYFDQFIEHEWFNAVRSRASLALILADVDFFQAYSHMYGHLAGNECLKQVAQRIQSCIRITDLVSRYDSEEFACVLPSTNVTGLEAICKKILDNINDLKITHKGSPKENHITISIGAVTGIPSVAASLDDFIRNADINLYQAKQSGNNRYLISELNFSRKSVLILAQDEELIEQCRKKIESYPQSINVIVVENGIQALIKIGRKLPCFIKVPEKPRPLGRGGKGTVFSAPVGNLG